jgi:hypothetical protein
MRPRPAIETENFQYSPCEEIDIVPEFREIRYRQDPPNLAFPNRDGVGGPENLITEEIPVGRTFLVTNRIPVRPAVF